jgi:toxin FitB
VSGYLVDTNVVSELRKRQRANRGVRRWFDSCEADDLFLSVLVVGELRHGIELLRRKDAVSARTLDRWLRNLERGYGDRILPVTLSICDRWGRLGLERVVPPIDGLLAATAIEHRLTLVTRNVAHVVRTGAEAVNPFE